MDKNVKLALIFNVRRPQSMHPSILVCGDKSIISDFEQINEAKNDTIKNLELGIDN